MQCFHQQQQRFLLGSVVKTTHYSIFLSIGETNVKIRGHFETKEESNHDNKILTFHDDDLLVTDVPIALVIQTRLFTNQISGKLENIKHKT
jgi:hypothetical protein